ncbi:MAG: GNAT family N-acetyltransferase [Planctomycetes bacterium]|nr:GNAT family N-acetyltransferase [Planctomycetota bacterium]
MRKKCVNSPEGWRIEILTRRHDREDFDCGERALDEFLKKFARQNQDRDISRTFIAVRGTAPKVLGYYTVSAHSIEASRLPPEMVRRFPRYPLPVVHVGGLAIDRSTQGQGLGEILLWDALKKAVLASDLVGVHAVEVMANTFQARRFYEKYGFVPIPEDPFHLILPLATARKLIQG